MAADRPATRLPPRLWGFLAGCLLSSVGSGLVAPFTAIYLTVARGFPLGMVGAVLGVVAAANIVGSAVAGPLIDRFGVCGTVVVSLLVEAVGFLLIGFVTTPATAAVVATLIGIGGGGFYPAGVPILVTLAPPHLRRRAFSVRSLVTSIGIGVGSAGGGLLLGASSVSTFQILFTANAVSYVALAVIIGAVLRGADPPELGGTGQTPPGTGLLRDPILRVLLVLETLIVLAGYGQFTSSVPLLLQTRLAVQPGLIGTVVAVSTIMVIVLQLPLGKLSERRTPARVLAYLGLVWAVAWCFGLVAVATHGTPRTVALITMAVLYGAGACLFQPNFQPLLAAASPPERLGRASGYAASAWGIALVIAAPAGVLLVAMPPAVLWLALIAVSLAAAALARRVGALVAPTAGLDETELDAAAADQSRRQG